MRHFVQTGTLGLLLTFCATGTADDKFSVACSIKNENLSRCALLVADIVTAKFTARFPSTSYEIFAHSNIQEFSNGGFSAYAIVGVIPRNSGQFPLRTYSSTTIDGSGKIYSLVELSEIELRVYRQAVSNMMERCEISPKCDIYKSRDAK